MNAKRIGWFAVSTGIILAMLYFADISKFISHIQAADKPTLVAAIGVGLLSIPVWTNSWHKLINRVGSDISFYWALRLFTAGNFLNAVTPLGQFGGEPLMAYVIKENTGLEYEDSLSAVISADIINAVPILTFIAGGAAFMLFLGASSNLMVQMVYVAAMITLFGGSIAYLLWFRSGFIESRIVSFLRLVTSGIGRGDSYVDFLENRLQGLQEAFRTVGEKPVHLLKLSMIAHLYFVFQVFSLYLVMSSLGVETDFAPLYFVLPAASLANFSPTPGGSGTYEAAMAGILTAFLGVPGSLSVAVAILYRFTTFWPSILIGYISFTTLSQFDADEFRSSVD